MCYRKYLMNGVERLLKLNKQNIYFNNLFKCVEEKFKSLLQVIINECIIERKQVLPCFTYFFDKYVFHNIVTFSTKYPDCHLHK